MLSTSQVLLLSSSPCGPPFPAEYAELQQAARDGRAKPAVEAVVERVQKVG